MAGTGITGDLTGLGNLIGNLRRLSEVPSQAAREVSDAIGAEIELQFDHGIDPYGEPWEPLAQSTLDRGRSPPPLTDTTEMRTGISVRPSSGAGVQITIDAPYAGFHQTGTRFMPARKVLPEGSLPDTWERAFADALDNAFERRLSEGV